MFTKSAGLGEGFYFFFVPSGYDESAYDGQKTADCRFVEFQQDRIADSERDAVTEHDSAGHGDYRILMVRFNAPYMLGKERDKSVKSGEMITWHVWLFVIFAYK